MKPLITIFIILIGVGCGKSETVTETVKTEPKPLSPEEQKLVGSYELKFDGNTAKVIFFENGKVENWQNGKKEEEGTWKLVGKEVHCEKMRELDKDIYDTGSESEEFKGVAVAKIEPNGDLTAIAEIIRNKRTELPKEDQLTLRKFK